ncbi:MAG TPA: hypothetical protein VH855_22960 [Acetobacteraceae bacterium]
MIGARSALLGAGLLLGAPAAMAATPEGGHYVWVPNGAEVIVVPHETVAPVDFPVAHMVAQQEAMMRRMFADMDSLMATALPDPDRMIRSVMSGLPQVPAGSPMGSTVVVTSITTPGGTCSQTITYGSPGKGSQPVVHVSSSSGDACGTIHSSSPLTVTQPLPEPRTVAPVPARPRHERLWTVGYPPHRITPGIPPRT